MRAGLVIDRQSGNVTIPVVSATSVTADMVDALGINVPVVFMLVFGIGTWLAGVAGVEKPREPRVHVVEGDKALGRGEIPGVDDVIAVRPRPAATAGRDHDCHKRSRYELDLLGSERLPQQNDTDCQNADVSGKGVVLERAGNILQRRDRFGLGLQGHPDAAFAQLLARDARFLDSRRTGGDCAHL